MAHRGNKRIQVGNAGSFNMQSTNIGAPSAISISPGAHRYLFTSDPNPSTSMDNGEIHKMESGGPRPRPVPAGKLLKEFG